MRARLRRWLRRLGEALFLPDLDVSERVIGSSEEIDLRKELHAHRTLSRRGG